jgi:hypothetical protein
MLNIISTFYISKYNSHLDKDRSKEIEDCLIKNLKNPIVDKIHLFVDDEHALRRLNEISNNSEKIFIISIGLKPKYNDFFNYIIENIQNEICMITNADIYIHECEINLIKRLKKEKICYALTRYEHDMSHPLIDTYCGSHDCYIFNSSFIDKQIINKHTDFLQNVLGIESRIIKTFCDKGFRVYNPCRQIKIVHLHKTQLRNHGNWCGLHRCSDWDYHRSSCWWVPPS